MTLAITAPSTVAPVTRTTTAPIPFAPLPRDGGTSLPTVPAPSRPPQSARWPIPSNSPYRSLAMDIDGKVALVTGAGSGIGRASALALAREGAAVVVGDIAEGPGRETVGLIERAGGRAAFVAGDVSDPDQLAAMFEAAAEAFGGLDIVHNNAGIVCGEPLWPGTDPADLFRQVAVNLG